MDRFMQWLDLLLEGILLLLLQAPADPPAACFSHSTAVLTPPTGENLQSR